MRVDAEGFVGLQAIEALTLHDADLSAANTAQAPGRVIAHSQTGVRVDGSAIEVTLKLASWNVIRLRVLWRKINFGARTR